MQYKGHKEKDDYDDDEETEREQRRRITKCVCVWYRSIEPIHPQKAYKSIQLILFLTNSWWLNRKRSKSVPTAINVPNRFSVRSSLFPSFIFFIRFSFSYLCHNLCALSFFLRCFFYAVYIVVTVSLLGDVGNSIHLETTMAQFHSGTKSI